jgi:hypothetical protein
MQLNIRIFLAILLIGLGSKSFAQHKVEILDGEALYKKIYKEAYDNIDEFQRINENGILLIKFDFEGGKISNIKFSSAQPQLLIRAFQAILKNSSLNIKKPTPSTSLVIPVLYNYKTSLSNSANDLVKQMPSINVNNLGNPSFQDSYDKFLGINSNDGKIFGVSCLVLPWVKLNGKTQ